MFTNRGNLSPKGQILDQRIAFDEEKVKILRSVIHPKWNTVIAVTPDIDGRRSRVWPREFKRISQGMSDLGERMLKILDSFRFGPICIIGSDIPDVNAKNIERAFKLLMNKDFVLGPTLDGDGHCNWKSC